MKTRLNLTLICATLLVALGLGACAPGEINGGNNGNTQTDIYYLLNNADAGDASVAVNLGAPDFACNGEVLTQAQLNTVCPDRTRLCWHVCGEEPNRTNSRADQAWQGVRTVGANFKQWGDSSPGSSLEYMYVASTTGTAGYFWNIQPNQSNWALFTIDWVYPAASNRPPLRAISQTYNGLGLDTNGVTRVYYVAFSGVQTLMENELVALDNQCPTITTDGIYGARSTSWQTGTFPNGGAFSPMRPMGDTGGSFPCPSESNVLRQRTTGDFRCDRSHADERLWGQASTGIAGCVIP